MDKWALSVIKKAEKSVKIPNGVTLPAKPRLKGFEKLVAKLKKKHNAQNVSIFFMLNNYYLVDLSAVINAMSHEEEHTEFAVNSGKNTNVLANQLLSLFGAQGLNPDYNSRYKVKNIELAKTDFPDDIMVNFEKDINNLKVDSFTAYMLGWTETVAAKYRDFHKIKITKREKKTQYN